MQYPQLLKLTATAAWQEWYAASAIACQVTASIWHTFTGPTARHTYRLIAQLIGQVAVLALMLIDRHVQSCLRPTEDVGTASSNAGATADGITHAPGTFPVHKDAGAAHRDRCGVAWARGQVGRRQMGGVVVTLPAPRDTVHEHVRTALSPRHG